MLTVGEKAPEFTLQDKDGNTVSLSDFAGKKVVVYFYPKDNTPGCTRQACAFAGLYGEFQKKGVEVIGISRDSVASHGKFAQKHSLPFLLLSDPELQAIQAYGVWQEKKLYGKVSMGVVRTTFVIDEQGNIERIMPKVKPDTNAAEILEQLKKTLAGEILCPLFLTRSPLGKNKETCKKWPKARRCGKKAHRGPFAPVVPGGISCYNTGKHLT